MRLVTIALYQDEAVFTTMAVGMTRQSGQSTYVIA
jgi:hypothetical protein